MEVDIFVRYPLNLHQQLLETIPLLCRSKTDLLAFFVDAGVKGPIIDGLNHRVHNNRGSISKYKITRTILIWLNEHNTSTLCEKREIVKRVIAWEDFAACRERDRLEAQSRVAQIQHMVKSQDREM